MATLPAAKRGAWSRLSDDLRFFRSWLKNPTTVGAVLPTSWRMARRMASVVDVGSTLPVLELGPGTGVVTRAMLERGVDPKRIVSLEYSPEFCRQLRVDFPAVEFVEGDAFDLANAIGARPNGSFDCVVSSLPLLHFPLEKRIALMNELVDLVAPGRPVLQFSYGLVPSVPRGRGHYSVERYDIVLRNVPPAQLWIYRRA